MTTRGDRLRSYLLRKTGGRPGWQRDLCAATGIKRQTVSKWTSPAFEGYPDLSTLAVMAEGLGVPTFEIVAALDGDVAVSLSDPRTREALRSEIETVLDERLGPRRDSGGRVGAA